MKEMKLLSAPNALKRVLLCTLGSFAAKCKLLILLLGVFATQQAYAQLVGDLITIEEGGVTYYYEVSNANPTSREVKAVGVKEQVTSLTIPATIVDKRNNYTYTVSKIAWRAGVGFHGTLTSLTLSDKIKSLDYIGGLGAMKSFRIPKNVNYIHPHFFASMKSLSTIEVDPNNRSYYVKDGVLFKGTSNQHAKSSLHTFPAQLKPTHATEEGRYDVDCAIVNTASIMNNPYIKHVHFTTAFKSFYTPETNTSFLYNCENAQTITVDPNHGTLRDIDNVIYQKADNKSLVLYPASLSEIGEYKVADGCKEILSYAIKDAKFTSINLNEVTKLNNNSFVRCALTSFHIPNEISEIPTVALYQCQKIAKYIVDKNHPTLEVDDDGVAYQKANPSTGVEKTLKYYPQGRELPYTVAPETKVIAQQAFQYAKITEVTIPKTVTKIGSYAFSRCYELTKVNFAPDAQLKEIGGGAFHVCQRLSEITIPKTVTTIGNSAFSEVASKRFVPEGFKFAVEAESDLATLGEYIFLNTNLVSFKFLGTAEKFKKIPARAFRGVKTLTTLQLPSNVEEIGDEAFKGCTGLTQNIFDENSPLTKIGVGAFADCTGLPNIKLPKGLRSVQDQAFRNCAAITSVEIGKDATEVDPRAFVGCTGLEEFVVDPQNATYTAHEKMLFSKDKKKLVVYPQGLNANGEVKLPASTAIIGKYAFLEAVGLGSIDIPKSVVRIELEAFHQCKNLTKVTLRTPEKLPLEYPLAEQQPNQPIHKGIDKSAFPESVRNQITFYVPQDLLAAYQADNYFKTGESTNDALPLKSVPIDYVTTYGEKLGVCKYEVKGGFATFTGVTFADGKTPHTFVLPASINVPTDVAATYGVSAGNYNVNAIAEVAFGGVDAALKEVVLSGNITQIHGRAFMTQSGVNTSTIENIIVAAAMAPSLLDSKTDATLNEFGTNQKIYVRNSKLATFKKDWEAYKTQITDVIPGAPINTQYKTFSREFDVDLDLGGATSSQLHAFIGGVKLLDGEGDYRQDGEKKTTKKVSFKSIHVASGKKEGTYIPKGTAVLLKNMGNSSPLAWSYRIGEAIATTPIAESENALRPVLEMKRRIKKVTTGGNLYYALQKGTFREINNPESDFNANLHTAYLLIKNNASQGAPLAIFFDTDDITTSVNEVEVATPLRPTYYDLQGKSVSNPRRGLYISNGRKLFIR